MKGLVRKLINLLSLVCLKILSSKTKSYDFAIIKTDAIGDMFIFFNVLKHIGSHELLKGKKVLIICQKMNSDLIMKFFPDLEIHVVENNSFQQRWLFNDHQMRSLSKIKVETLINLMPSRDIFSDLLTMLIHAENKIGFSGDLSKQGSLANSFGKCFYKKLYSFESDRSEFQMILNLIQSELGSFALKALDENKSSDRRNIVIFPGSSWTPKNWPIQNFEILIQYLLEKRNEEIYVCGGGSEVELGRRLKQIFGDKIQDQTGKTGLLDLCELIKQAKLVISNDTSAAHIAQFFETPSIVLVGGGHGDRFLPYKHELCDSHSIILRHRMDCYLCNWSCRHALENGAVPCIARIEVQKVFESVENFLC